MSSFLDLASLCNDPAVIQGLIDGTIRAHEVPQLSTCAGSHAGSILDFKNKAKMLQAGGDVDHKLYHAANDPLKPYSRIHPGNPNATLEIERSPGFAVMRYDPEDAVDVAAAGGSDGFLDALAKDVKLRDRDALTCALAPTTGWTRSSLTPTITGRTPNGVIPNKYRFVIYHKKGFKIDNGGPAKLRTDEGKAAYRREVLKRKR